MLDLAPAISNRGSNAGTSSETDAYVYVLGIGTHEISLSCRECRRDRRTNSVFALRNLSFRSSVMCETYSTDEEATAKQNLRTTFRTRIAVKLGKLCSRKNYIVAKSEQLLPLDKGKNPIME